MYLCPGMSINKRVHLAGLIRVPAVVFNRFGEARHIDPQGEGIFRDCNKLSKYVVSALRERMVHLFYVELLYVTQILSINKVVLSR